MLTSNEITLLRALLGVYLNSYFEVYCTVGTSWQKERFSALIIRLYEKNRQLRGNTCPQCSTGPLQHTDTEDFITDGWRGQRWHYTCNHCDWSGSEEVAVGPYEENERDSIE